MTIIGELFTKIQDINESYVDSCIKQLDKGIRRKYSANNLTIYRITIRSRDVFSRIKKMTRSRFKDLYLDCHLYHSYKYPSPDISINFRTIRRRELSDDYHEQYRFQDDQIEAILQFVRELISDKEILPYLYVKDHSDNKEQNESVATYYTICDWSQAGRMAGTVRGPLMDLPLNKLPSSVQEKVKELQAVQDEEYDKLMK